jgi:hypothetical protein
MSKRAQSWELGGERPSVINPRANVRAKRRARPFARWTALHQTMVAYDGQPVFVISPEEMRELVVRALNAAKVTLPRPRAGRASR